MNCTWAATWGAGEGSKAALSGSEGGLLGKAAQQHRTEFVLLCCQVMQCVCVCGGGGGANMYSRKGRLPTTCLKEAWWFMAMPVPKRLWVSYWRAPLA
jgi:hypothetical protein